MSRRDIRGRRRSSSARPNPKSVALRPDTDLTFEQRDKVRRLVKRLTRIWKNRDMAKAEIYAEVARLMSLSLKREVPLREVELAAENAKTPTDNPKDFTVRLDGLHHGLLKTEAEAEGVHMRDITARALDAYFGLGC